MIVYIYIYEFFSKKARFPAPLHARDHRQERGTRESWVADAPRQPGKPVNSLIKSNHLPRQARDKLSEKIQQKAAKASCCKLGVLKMHASAHAALRPSSCSMPKFDTPIDFVLPAATKRSVFECFPYVCPEPVLVKSSFLCINGSKRPFFHLL
jgi:hypothetical protein